LLTTFYDSPEGRVSIPLNVPGTRQNVVAREQIPMSALTVELLWSDYEERFNMDTDMPSLSQYIQPAKLLLQNTQFLERFIEHLDQSHNRDPDVGIESELASPDNYSETGTKRDRGKLVDYPLALLVNLVFFSSVCVIELLLRFPLPEDNISKKHAYPDGMWVLFEPVESDDSDRSNGLDESEHYEAYGSFSSPGTPSPSQKSSPTASQASTPQQSGTDSDSHSLGDEHDGAATCRNVVGDKDATNKGMPHASAS